MSSLSHSCKIAVHISLKPDRGSRAGSVVARSTVSRCVVGSSPTHRTEHFDFPPVPHDWVVKGLGISICVCATGHIKDPVPLTEKRKGLSLGGRFPPFIHQVIITE